MSTFLVLLFSAVLAQAKPACTVEALTNDCKFFTESGKSEFVLPDGTRFPNSLPDSLGFPVELPGQDGSEEEDFDQERFGFASEGVDAVARMQEASLEAQSDLILSLGQGDSSLNPKFMLSVTSEDNLTAYGEWLNRKARQGAAPFPATLSLPWPPHADKPKIQQVSAERFQKEFLDRLPKEQKTLFEAKSKSLARLLFGGNEDGEEHGGGMGRGAPAPSDSGRIRSSAETVTASEEVAPSVSRAVAEMKKTFDETKELFIEEFTKGRAVSSLSPEEKILFEKIKEISYIAPDSEKAKSLTYCNGLSPNAFYLPNSNELVVCPSFLNYPKANLVQVLAHEMAHSIDPCAGCRDIYHVNKKELSRIVSEERTDTASELFKTRAGSDRLDLFQASELRWLEEQGWIEKRYGGVSPDRYPYLEAMSCFEKSISMDNATTEDLRRWAKSEGRRLKASGSTEREAGDFEKYRFEGGGENPLCPKIDDEIATQAGEVLSDAWGTKVLGRYLEKNPPRSPADKVGAMAFFATNYCLGRESVLRESGRRGSGKSAHPYDRERLNAILMTDHRIQKAMGCEAVPGQVSCLKSLGTMKTPKAGGGRAKAGSGSEGKK